MLTAGESSEPQAASSSNENQGGNLDFASLFSALNGSGSQPEPQPPQKEQANSSMPDLSALFSALGGNSPSPEPQPQSEQAGYVCLFGFDHRLSLH